MTLETEARNGLTGARLWGWQTYLSLAATAAVFALWPRTWTREVWRQVVASDKRFLFLAALSLRVSRARGRWRRLSDTACRCGSGRFALLAFFSPVADNFVPAARRHLRRHLAPTAVFALLMIAEKVDA